MRSRGARLAATLPPLAIAWVSIGHPALAEPKRTSMTISGMVSMSEDGRAVFAPGDRLVLKLFHLDEDIEKDARYWIIDEPVFPRRFELTPSVDMNGRTRWSDYRIEASTDRDGDVLDLSEGELSAQTDGSIPLGATELVLELLPIIAGASRQ